MLSTRIPNRLPASSGIVCMATVARLLSEIVVVMVIGGAKGSAAVGASGSAVTRTVPGRPDRLAIWTYVAVPRVPPASPSASTHRMAPVGEPAEACASVQKLGVTSGPGNHIDCSTTMGTTFSTRIMVPITVLLSNGGPPGRSKALRSPSTQTVRRLWAGTT